jgi:hypothetical protein
MELMDPANNKKHAAYQEKKKPTWEQSEGLLVGWLFFIWFDFYIKK